MHARIIWKRRSKRGRSRVGRLRVTGTGGHRLILLVRLFFARGCPNSSPQFSVWEGAALSLKGREADGSLSIERGEACV